METPQDHEGQQQRPVDDLKSYLTTNPPFRCRGIDFDDDLHPVEVDLNTCAIDLLCMIKNFLQCLAKHHQVHNSPYALKSSDARYMSSYIYLTRAGKRVDPRWYQWWERRTDPLKYPEPILWVLPSSLQPAQQPLDAAAAPSHDRPSL
ncbi:hypothetical protein OC845_003406 [Tilletia horrida]|nr:hypothetical protein OC845_003406 [Tilletia horrida]